MLDMVETGPNLDVPTLPRPKQGQNLDGPVGQYSRRRFLDMEQIATNLVTFKQLLEVENQNWKKNGIPLKLKVKTAAVIIIFFKI